ncbi:PHA/PHB synthase family protein [Bordetella petrii]|uniref:Alpha/beta fold hydrolase n=1 Tax=Bordetella petrii TaxID=94624 RepID=A0ABT7W5G7_9BORD|nr:alpha/beta fold hydrolase [Bordetella petrii]MDM9560410.1 alpha/beta fold hydrolase [Bordetella petrii]
MQPNETADYIPPTAALGRLDPLLHAWIARRTGSLSPASVGMAVADWWLHLAFSPDKQAELTLLALRQSDALSRYLAAHLCPAPAECGHDLVEPPAADRRFAAPQWQKWPFSLWHQSFLLAQTWWQSATTGLRGVERHHEAVVSFAARQWLDLCSPGNLPATNPIVLQRTVERHGLNLLAGAMNALEDWHRHLAELPPAGADRFQVGRDVAVSPGKVVRRNRLIELIQYSPATGTVHPEPVLIVPAWIMKYYVLDLSPHNSLVRYLVSQGYTVFCISWKNPGTAERDLGMDDYLELGIGAALAAVAAIVPGRRIHAAGYCLGGTLLSIAAAAMARDGDARLATLSLLTAQTDFSEPGELGLFIDESQVCLLEAQMAQTGYLSAAQMAGAFQMLRSYDLLWSRLVNVYLLGERRPMNDLMAWNADATRMPARMHAEYLRRLFLDNDLSSGRYPVGGRPVALSELRLPMFAVGTLADHVAPWRSAYKLHYLSTAEITFVLTSGGHNAGIVSEPGRAGRYYRIQTHPAGGAYMAPDEWERRAPRREGSWWPQWARWLRARSGRRGPPPAMGAPEAGYRPLCDAPGRYVREK